MKGSLKKNSQFQKVYEDGCSYANRYLVIYIVRNDLDVNRFGMSVSRKVGNSVVRHRIQRLVRECMRNNHSMLKKGFDIVIIARTGAKDRTYQEIESAVMHLMKLHRIVCKEI